MDYEIANFIVMVIHTFMCVSSPMNLIVFCSMSSKFRRQFSKLVTSMPPSTPETVVSVPPGPTIIRSRDSIVRLRAEASEYRVRRKETSV